MADDIAEVLTDVLHHYSISGGTESMRTLIGLNTSQYGDAQCGLASRFNQALANLIEQDDGISKNIAEGCRHEAPANCGDVPEYEDTIDSYHVDAKTGKPPEHYDSVTCNCLYCQDKRREQPVS